MDAACPFDELMSFLQLQSGDLRIENKTAGVIGGHCVMPNIAILRKTYPSPLWDYLENSNNLKIQRERQDA